MPTYFKLIRKDKINRGFKYHLGLNVDPQAFNPDGAQECVAGGIYFSKITDILRYLDDTHEWIAELTLPENTLVVEFKDKSRAHQVFITKFYDLSKVSTWKYLVKTGADIYADDDYALRWAARRGHLSIVKYLVKTGSDIHATNECALRVAAKGGRLSVVKYLVKRGVDIHVDYDCALRLAVEFDRLSVVKYLVKKGSNIHALNDYALRVAANMGCLSIVKYLVKTGSDIHALNDCALRWAEGNFHSDVAKYLKGLK